jgi:hypothetical protein
MDDPMTNGDANRQYISVTEAQLGERVTNLGRRQSDLETEMRAGFRSQEQSLTAFTNEVRNSLAQLSQTIAERNKPQWQALGVALAFAGMLGGLAYMPIREATNDLKTAVSGLTEKVVTRQEMDQREQRRREDAARVDGAIIDLRQNGVARSEWTERSKSVDQAIQDANRRIDELRGDFGAVYGTRDVIRDMKNEIDELRQRQARLREPP